MEDIENFDQMINLLKVISEPNRLMLLDKIIDGIQCNCELGKSLSLAPNLVSHHLSKLCHSGLITAERDEHDARWIHYRVNEATLDKFRQLFNQFTDPERIKEPRSICPPNRDQELTLKSAQHF